MSLNSNHIMYYSNLFELFNDTVFAIIIKLWILPHPLMSPEELDGNQRHSKKMVEPSPAGIWWDKVQS